MPNSGTTRRDTRRRTEQLRVLLEHLHDRYHDPRYLEHDPLSRPHRYSCPADRLVAALIAASFAFGNVASILSAVDSILEPLLPHPAQAITAREPGDWGGLYRGFQYRWIRAADLRLYLAWIGSALREHGTLGSLWRGVDNPADETVLPALDCWVDALTSQPAGSLRGTRRTLKRANGTTSRLPAGAHLLLTSPRGKSSCKRMLLFLKWVCRPADGVDLGLWRVDPARLVMPVDTHIMQASSLLGLTRRRTPDLKTAQEITAALRRVCPEDPTRYDFALTRPGINRLKEDWAELRQG